MTTSQPYGLPADEGERLEAVLEQARENDRKLRRFENFELRVIGAEDLTELCTILLADYPAVFALEATTLHLVDTAHDIRRLLQDDAPDGGLPANLHLCTHDSQVSLLEEMGSAPVLGVLDPGRMQRFFPGQIPQPLRTAILPLVRHRRTIGALCLGSRDPARFAPGAGTDFLQRFAQITSLCVENAVSLHRLKRTGLTDALTGVKNRRFFDQRLAEEISRACRSLHPLACLFIDVDHFKGVNDRYGHASGDAVLRQVAARAAQQLRGCDVLARYGGEEFGALLPATDAGDALEVAERIRETVGAEPFRAEGGELLHLSVSIGLALLRPTGEERDFSALSRSLVGGADAALYRAKGAGRNRVMSDSDPAGHGPSREA